MTPEAYQLATVVRDVVVILVGIAITVNVALTGFHLAAKGVNEASV